MRKYAEVESGAYMQRAENGFIVEVVQVEERDHDPRDLVEAGEPHAMGEIRAQQLPKVRTPVPKTFVYATLEEALVKLEEYFSD